MRRISTVMSLAAAGVVAASAVAGPDWVEGTNDAGSFFFSAQPTLGLGTLKSIAGNLSFGLGFAGAADFEDVYLITITDPGTFSLSITSANFNPQMFIFNITLPGQLFGLLANDDTMSSNLPTLGNVATDVTGAQITTPGQYAIAISGVGRVPVSSTGALFNFGNPFEVSGADGPGGLNPLSGWVGEGEVGTYVIDLEGVGFYDLPAPGALALLALAGVGGSRRRRHTVTS